MSVSLHKLRHAFTVTVAVLGILCATDVQLTDPDYFTGLGSGITAPASAGADESPDETNTGDERPS